MKKNNTMRVAAGLAVAALLSTCLVSGTFAKYVTTANAHDEARVAKFGVKIEPQAYEGIFAKAYDNTVVSSNTDDVVAPGTSGIGAQAVTITGTPEVSVAVENKGEVTLSDWSVNNGQTDIYYCPIVVRVGSDEIKGLDYDSMTAFETAIEDKINAISKTYAPGQTIDNEACPAITWSWAIEKSGTGGKGAQTDPDDTALGDAANAKIDIKVTTTVTQID